MLLPVNKTDHMLGHHAHFHARHLTTNTFDLLPLRHPIAVVAASISPVFAAMPVWRECQQQCIPDIRVAAIEPIHFGNIDRTDHSHKQHATWSFNLVEVSRDKGNSVMVRQHIWPATCTAHVIAVVLAVHHTMWTMQECIALQCMQHMCCRTQRFGACNNAVSATTRVLIRLAMVEREAARQASTISHVCNAISNNVT